MATEKVNVVITTEDKTSAGWTKARQTAEKEIAKTNAAVKQSGSIAQDYTRKFNEQVKELAFRFVGLTAAIGTVRYLAQAVKDAGLQTEEANKAMGRISATIGAQLLPDVQALVDLVVQNQDKIAIAAAKTVNLIKMPFDVLANSIAGSVGLIYTAIGKLTRNKEWQAMGKALGEEFYKGMESVVKTIETGGGEIKVRGPVKKTGSKKDMSGDSDQWKTAMDFAVAKREIAAKLASEDAETMKRMDQEILAAQQSLSESKMLLIKDEYDREMQLLLLKQEQEMAALGDNYYAKSLLAESYTNQVIDLENRQLKAKQDVQAQEKAMSISSTDLVLSNLAQMTEGRKEFFGLYKATAAGSAMINAFSAAQAQWSQVLAVVPPPLGPVLASLAYGTTIGTGLMQAQKIATAKFARGTNYAPGGMALVGEEGPELVNLPRGSQVKTAQQTRQIIGGTTIVLNLRDHSGDLVDSITRKLRSGDADRLVAEIQRRVR